MLLLLLIHFDILKGYPSSLHPSPVLSRVGSCAPPWPWQVWEQGKLTSAGVESGKSFVVAFSSGQNIPVLDSKGKGFFFNLLLQAPLFQRIVVFTFELYLLELNLEL